MRRTTPQRKRGRIPAPKRPMRRFAPGQRPNVERCRQLALPRDLYDGVLAGRITQLRTDYLPRGAEPSFTDLPTGLMLWTPHAVMPDAFTSQLYTCTSNWSQPLGEATSDDIRREGFADRTGWRRWWMAKMDDGLFDPLLPTEVFAVRPFHPVDLSALGEQLARNLYGQWLDGNPHDRIVGNGRAR